ncbi:hypothetical protein A0128_05950 [Leptospira tipperaryensis]|uniref:Uncharacterized protein n=1 Tax=Leptospira tipperaryensis TaxID=2564040 RepID=A0A1D7UUZ2_9LEPT|nr:hypothetical protein [Leptospira tipperaryensis]AOP33427.1 hypothetical protein A0128_05950 [Leptospira tipperaryensis]
MSQNTFKFLHILLFILLSFSIFECKKSGQRPDFDKEIMDPKIALEIQKDKDILRSEIKNSYVILNSSHSVEEALSKAINEIRDSPDKDDDQLKYSCNPKEIREIYLPNNIDQNNITANSKIEDSMYLLLIRRKAGIDKVRQNLRGSKGPLQILPLPKPYNVRKLTNINGYIIKEFKVQLERRTIDIDEIKLIIEHKNQFKVCTYGT